MGKIQSLTLTLVCMVLLLIPGCKKSSSDSQAFTPADQDPAGELKVSFMSPMGSTGKPDEAESVIVIFDHPMIPLASLSSAAVPALIEFEPRVSGKFRWLNPKTLSFSPEKPFPFATEINARIPGGTRSFEGFELPQDHTWKFKTIVPRLVNHFPKNKQQWLELDTDVLLIFNMPMDKKKTEGFISLIGVDDKGNEAGLDFTLVSPSLESLKDNDLDIPHENVLQLLPSLQLKPEQQYFIEIKAGLKAKSGELGLAKSRIFEFRTFKSFKFVQLHHNKPHNPHDALHFKFSNPVVYKELVSHIHFKPEVAVQEYYSNWDLDNSSLWLNLPLAPETEYLMRIDPELNDRFGNRLGKEIELTFTTSPYSSSIDITSGHGILESYGDLRYPLYAVNADKVLVRLAKLKKDQVIPLAMMEDLFWSRNNIQKKGFYQNEITMPLNRSRNQREIFPIELKKFLPDSSGLVFIQLDTYSRDDWSRFPKSFLQVTKMGISAKYSPENNIIWITGLQDGLPIADVKVEIRDDKNRIRWQGRTGFDGRVLSPGWKHLGITSSDEWRKPRQWILAQKGNDIAFTSSEWETGVYPYRFDIPYDWNPEPELMRGYIFSERGIYRAGETINLKGIIREQAISGWSLPQDQEILCDIRDPFNKSIFKKNFRLDEFGSFAAEIETSMEAALGNYRVIVTTPENKSRSAKTSFYASFRVEAFRPAEFEVHLRTPQESYIFGDEYKAELRADYLFGGAMSSQKIKWHLRLNSAWYAPPGYDDYIFGNQVDSWLEHDREKSRLLSSGEQKLDKQGKFVLKTKLVPEKEVDTVSASLEATIQGPSRRTVSNRIQTIVHRGRFYIGIKPESRFISHSKNFEYQVLSIRPDGEIFPGRKIKLSLFRREWHSVRKAEMGGRFRWLSEKKDLLIESRTIKTAAQPKKETFKPEKAGYYIINAEGKDRKGNQISTSTYFYVTGKDYVPWERQDDDAVELVADKASYQPGDTARIMVKSPYEKARALVSIEREHILDSWVVEVIGSSQQLEIPIVSEHLPNVYISVLLVHGRSSTENAEMDQDLGKPSFKIGYVKLDVDPAEKRLGVQITELGDNYAPGEEASFKLKVTDSRRQGTVSSVAIAVVDVGVLNLIGYRTPDPFAVFYRQKPLSVQTSETRHHVVGQRSYGEKGDESGGGAGGAHKAGMAMSLSEVDLRGDFRFTAYWNPSILTDETGVATVSFRLPDNLTTFRIMAVAQTTDSRFGRTDSSFKVSKSLLLQPALPRFARIGDEFSGGVVLHNNSLEAAQVSLECMVEGIILKDKKTSRSFQLQPGESIEALFPFKAEFPGTASFSFRAITTQASDGVSLSIPVLLPRPSETTALFNNTLESIEEKIKIPENVYSEFSKLEFRASSTALSGLKGSLDYLINYPYTCLEQRLSALLPFLTAGDIIIDFELSDMDKKTMQAYVKKSINEIYSYQKESGGLSLWPDSRYITPFNSCYAAFTLIKAQASGYQVDQTKLADLTRFLQNLVRGRIKRNTFPYNKTSWNTTKAFALYCLALLEQPQPAYMEQLYKQREQLSLFGKTMLLKALFHGKGGLSSQTTLVQELLNLIKVSPTLAHFEERPEWKSRWIYSSNIRTTALILQSLLEIGSEHSLIPPLARWLVERKKAGGWISTQDNVYAFYALNEYYRRYEIERPEYKIGVTFAGKLLMEEVFSAGKKGLIQQDFSLQPYPAGKILPLNINKTGPGMLYYETRLKYAPAHSLNARDEGFTVYKSFLDLEGKPITKFKAGELLVVSLQVIIPQERMFVVINDPLPAGLEAVNPSFQTTSREQQQDLSQLSADAKKGWWTGFNHIEIHDDRVLLFADSLTPGIHTHYYLARALTFGTFINPGTYAEEMYSPEVFGRSQEEIIKIQK